AVALALVHEQNDDPALAAQVLAECGAGQENDGLSAALLLQAGITHWRGGNKKAAVECFLRAHERSAQAAGPMLSFALRAAEPNDLNARRQALESAGSDGALGHLERFALESGPEGNPAEAAEALKALVD